MGRPHFLTLVLVPGHFGNATPALLKRIDDGGAGIRLRAVLETAGDPVPDSVRVPSGLLEWLAGTPVGKRRASRVAALVRGAGERSLELIALGSGAPGRVVLLLSTAFDPDGARGIRDVELAYAALACSALARESQGAALVLEGIEVPDVSPGAGTVAEQVRAILADVGPGIRRLLAASDTAESLGILPGLLARPLSGLTEYRAS